MKSIILIGVGMFVGWNTTMPGAAKTLQDWVIPQVREMLSNPPNRSPIEYRPQLPRDGA